MSTVLLTLIGYRQDKTRQDNERSRMQCL